MPVAKMPKTPDGGPPAMVIRSTFCDCATDRLQAKQDSCHKQPKPFHKLLLSYMFNWPVRCTLKCAAFQMFFYLLQKARRAGAIDDSMVGRQCRRHHGFNLDAVAIRDHARRDPADG